MELTVSKAELDLGGKQVPSYINHSEQQFCFSDIPERILQMDWVY